PSGYTPAIRELIIDRLPELGPGSPDDGMHPRLAALSIEQAFMGQRIVDRDAARCCLSAVWLWHDFLDESHLVSHDIDTTEGGYWHGIMHRREPDYGNAKYWFRRVPRHPIFEPLAKAAGELAAKSELDGPAEYLVSQRDWDSFRFVDLCEAIAR